MTCCAVPGCSNSSRKGFKLYQLPKNPARRKEWHVKAKRDKWTPTPTSKICEVHFESHQFHKVVNGRRSLKPNAVPTIFAHTRPTKTRKTPTLRGLPSTLKV